MSIYLKTFAISIIIFLIVDIIWLGLIANKLYSKELGSMLKPNVNWAAAIIFYIIFIIALSVFVTVPALNEGSLKKVILLGALFGFTAYATYDLTNYATLAGFPLKIVIIDLIWGTFLGTSTATLTYIVYNGVFK